MADKTSEQIKYGTEVLKMLVLLAVATGGGSFSLVLGPLTAFRLIVAALGFVVTLLFVIAVWRRHRQIESLLARIKETV